MLFAQNYKLRRTPVNYRDLFVVMFWATIIFGFINICMLISYVFINPNDAKNVQYGQALFLGFYEVVVKGENIGRLNPMSIVLAITVILNTAMAIITYWSFRNSRFLNYIDNVHVSSVLIIIVTFIVFLFVINVFNRPIIDYQHLDIINNGWNTNIEDNNYIAKFNYVYDIHFINDNGIFINAIFVYSRFFFIWVTIICIFWIIIFVFMVTLFYNSNVSITLSKRTRRNG